jgi:subfamily B ATP-binding cassette protein MsbA
MTFNRPLSGRVLVDGHDLTAIKLRDYRQHLGVVLQDNFLFDGTIAENIAYARPHASRDEIKAVSRIAHCDEFIEGFEQGYDTIVGERGVRPVGRAAPARGDRARDPRQPEILILDEATSSLDSESEAMIQDGLKALRKGRTTFVIAHSAVDDQERDQILVLEHRRDRRAGHARGTAGQWPADTSAVRHVKYQLRKEPTLHHPGEDFHAGAEKVAAAGRVTNAL